MALKTLVKLGNVNNLSDARYGAGMGVGLMGFNFSPNAGIALNKDSFTEITGWISGVELVAEFTDESFEDIEQTLNGLAVQYIQTENFEVISKALALEVPVIYKINSIQVLDSFPAETLCQAQYILLQNMESLTQNTISDLGAIASTYPLLVGGNITTEDLDALLQLPIAGIALEGGDEIRPGFKDFDSMADILEQLETE